MAASTLLRLRAAMTDPGRLAPASRWAGVTLDEVEPGLVRARIPSAAVLPGPGATLLLADFVLGAGIGTHLPAGRRVGTLTLHASLLADRGDGGLVAIGTLTHLAGDTGVSRAEVYDDSGGLVAALSCRCAVLVSAGHPSPPPAAATVDVRVADPAMANCGGGVQGGVLAAALARALELERGELDVTYLRPVPADGAALAVRAAAVHAGSRFVVGRAELDDTAGRLAAVATGSRWIS